MDSQRIAVIVPALNEAASILSVVQGLRSCLPDSEIVVVDDGSTDATPDVAAEAGARVVSHTRNRGYGAALKSGIRASSRDYVLFCDADGQHRPEDVARIVEQADRYDMVVGVRSKASYREWTRRPGKFCLRVFANYLAGEQIPDLTSGLRIVKRSVIEKYLHLMPRGFSFSATSTFALLKSDHNIGWVPITTERRLGKSTVRQWKHGPQALMLILRLTVLFEPLKVFLTIDAFLLLLTLMSFVIDIMTNPVFGIGEVTVAFSIATLIVFLFGLVCDQVSALRREIHD